MPRIKKANMKPKPLTRNAKFNPIAGIQLQLAKGISPLNTAGACNSSSNIDRPAIAPAVSAFRLRLRNREGIKAPNKGSKGINARFISSSCRALHLFQRTIQWYKKYRPKRYSIREAKARIIETTVCKTLL